MSGVPRTDGSWSQTLTFAADDRERLGIVCDRERVSQLESLGQLVGHCLAMSGQSLASWLLIGVDCGAYREQRVKLWKDGFEAAAAHKRSEFPVAAGLMSHGARCDALAQLPAVIQGFT